MYLDEFFDYKNQVMNDLLTNKNLVKLIDENIDMCHPEELIYKNVFPYEYVPETVEEGATFICCDVDLLSEGERTNKTVYKPVLYIWVFTHKSLLRLPEGGVRTDKLAHEITKVLNGSRFYGMGELELYSVRRFAPMMDYQGKQIVFHARDWNRPHPTGKQMPINRKTGVVAQ